MKLGRKLQKIATGEAWASGVDRYYRWKHPLTVDSLLQNVDRAKLNQICEKYHAPGEIKAWPKYTNYEHWLGRAVDHVRELRLDRDPKLSILDIGSGAGYFIFVLKKLGHRVFGLDLSEPELYGELFELLDLRRVVWRIEAFEPLPEIGRFDLVTAFAVCFNGHGSGKVWERKEWEFFLNDLQSRYLNPGGRIFLARRSFPHHNLVSCPIITWVSLRSKWAVGKARGGRISKSIRNRRATQPPVQFHRNPPGRGQLAVFPRCSLDPYELRYGRFARALKNSQLTDGESHVIYGTGH